MGKKGIDTLSLLDKTMAKYIERIIAVEAEINEETLSFSIKYDIPKWIKKKMVKVKQTTDTAIS